MTKKSNQYRVIKDKRRKYLTTLETSPNRKCEGTEHLLIIINYFLRLSDRNQSLHKSSLHDVGSPELAELKEQRLRKSPLIYRYFQN